VLVKIHEFLEIVDLSSTLIAKLFWKTIYPGKQLLFQTIIVPLDAPSEGKYSKQS
jgi:hypothetical protein